MHANQNITILTQLTEFSAVAAVVEVVQTELDLLKTVDDTPVQ